MSQTLLRRLVRAALCTAAFAAQAQGAGSTAPAARQDPLDARASVPAPGYSSPFSRWRGPGDDQPGSWRGANDAVARIGGWRAYAREATRPEATPAGKDSPRPLPLPPGHSGHKSP